MNEREMEKFREKCDREGKIGLVIVGAVFALFVLIALLEGC